MLRLMSLENLCACVGGVTLDPLEDRATVREGAWGSARPDPSGSQPCLQRPQCLARVFLPGPDGVPGCVEVLVLGLGFASAQGIRRSLIGGPCWGPRASLCVSGQLLPPQGRQPAGACWPEVSGLAGCWSDLPHVPRGIRVAVFQGQ